MSASLGPLAIEDGVLTICGYGGTSVRCDRQRISYLVGNQLCQEVLSAEGHLSMRISLPTRRLVWGRIVSVLGELVPPGGTETERTQITVFVGYTKWGQRLSDVWRLGRPPGVPYPQYVARQVEFWVANASGLGLDLLIDERSFATYARWAGRSRRPHDLRQAFERALADRRE